MCDISQLSYAFKPMKLPSHFHMNRERKALGAGQRFTTNKPRREKETKKYDYKTKYYQPANERRWNSWKDEKLVQLVENFKSKGEEIDYEYLSSYFK